MKIMKEVNVTKGSLAVRSVGTAVSKVVGKDSPKGKYLN